PAVRGGECRKLVLRGWRRHRPLQRSSLPGIGTSDHSMNSAPEEVNQEHENARAHQERSHCSQQVEPAPVHFGKIRVDASRHSTKAQEVNGEEREIKPNEKEPEIQYSQRNIQHAAGLLRAQGV